MIKQLFDDLFGPSIEEFRKIKSNLSSLKKEKKVIDRMKKVLTARAIILEEAQIQDMYGHSLAYRAFMETDDQIALSYKYLQNELEELRKQRQ